MSGKVPDEAIEQTLARAGRGDAQAWCHVVEMYSPRVFALIVRQCGDRDLAEEITQATFVKLVTQIGKARGYEERGRFDSWLFRIAMNNLRDEMRRRGRQARTMDMTSGRDEESDGQWARAEESLAARRDPASEDPLERMDRDEQVRMLKETIGQMSEADREILHLRHTAGLSFAQIAEALGQPLGTVLARGHRALGKLRQAMESRYVV